MAQILKRKKFLAIIALVVVVLAAVGGYMYTYYLSPRSEAINVGMVTSLTGPGSFGGTRYSWGVKLWADTVNQQGGIFVRDLGRALPINLIVYDDTTDPALSKSLVGKLATVDKVSVIIGGMNTPLCSATLPDIDRYQIPNICSSGTSSLWGMGWKYAFSPMLSEKDQGTIQARFISSIQPRPTKLAIIMAQSSYVVGVINDGMRPILKDSGFEIVYDQTYAAGTTDFTPLLTQAKAANPDGILLGSYIADCIVELRQMRAVNFRPKLVWMLGMWDAGSLISAEKDDANGVVGLTTWNPALLTTAWPSQKDWLQRVQDKYGVNATYDQNVFEGIGDGQVLQAAIEKAGSLNNDKIVAAMKTLDVITARGEWTTNEFHQNPKSPLIVIQVQAGKQVVVWPLEYSNAKLIYPLQPWTSS
jgi:branched-chain amino acid transport system substrate-binding protein